jgi:rhodanese-related sulfurtransferase
MSIPEVSVAELEVALAAGARVIDVRETDEYESGHVPGAVHIALATVPEHIGAFMGPGATYVICKAGGRSLNACRFLEQQGVANTVNVTGGTMEWIANGLPVVTGGAPL